MSFILQVVDGGPDCEGQFDLVEDRLMVGRHVTANVVLINRTVNKNHAVLTRTESGYFFEDWRSRSGTFANDVRVSAPVLLKDGDIIHMGTVKLVYLRKAAET